MRIGLTLTPRQLEIIRKRLRCIGLLAKDRKVSEQARLILCELGKAERRVNKNKDNQQLELL